MKNLIAVLVLVLIAGACGSNPVAPATAPSEVYSPNQPTGTIVCSPDNEDLKPDQLRLGQGECQAK
jgi:hypothetical protein